MVGILLLLTLGVLLVLGLVTIDRALQVGRLVSSVAAAGPIDMESFLGESVVVPAPLRTPRFTFEVLGPAHDVQDHDAWTGSIEHVRATPGFSDRGAALLAQAPPSAPAPPSTC